MNETKKKKHISDKPIYQQYLESEQHVKEIKNEVNMDDVDAIKYIEKEF